MDSVQLTGLVLVRRDTGESDRAVTLFTKEEGKVTVTMKGARKPSSRLVAASEPLTLLRLSATKGRARRFASQTQISTSYPKIRADYVRLLVGISLCEAIDSLTPSHMPDEDFYEFLEQAIGHLESSADPWVGFMWIALRLFELCGQAPSFATCHTCGKLLNTTQIWFSPHSGGAFCPDHQNLAPQGILSNGFALIGLAALAKKDSPPPHLKERNSAIHMIDLCLREFSEKEIKSLSYAINQTL